MSSIASVSFRPGSQFNLPHDEVFLTILSNFFCCLVLANIFQLASKITGRAVTESRRVPLRAAASLSQPSSLPLAILITPGALQPPRSAGTAKDC